MASCCRLKADLCQLLSAGQNSVSYRIAWFPNKPLWYDMICLSIYGWRRNSHNSIENTSQLLSPLTSYAAIQQVISGNEIDVVSFRATKWENVSETTTAVQRIQWKKRAISTVSGHLSPSHLPPVRVRVLWLGSGVLVRVIRVRVKSGVRCPRWLFFGGGESGRALVIHSTSIHSACTKCIQSIAPARSTSLTSSESTSLQEV